MKKTKIIGLLFLIHAVAYQAAADTNFRSYHEGRTDFDFTLNYFKTTSNFSASGSKSDLPSGRYLQTIDTAAQGRYVMFNDVALFAGLNVGSAESSDSIATRKNSTLTNVVLGSDFQLMNSNSFKLTGEILYSQNLEKIKQDTDSVLNSDGANEITALVGSNVNFDSIHFFTKGGVKYRTEGLSTLLLYTAGLEDRFDQFAIGASLMGYSTIKNDDYSDQAAYRDNVTARVDAFSKRYYAINPNILDTEFYFKYNFSQDMGLKAFAGYPILGSNATVGIHAGATASWGFGGNEGPHSYRAKDLEPRKTPVIRQAPVVQPPVHHVQPSAQKPTAVPPSKGSFKEDTDDGVNQNYFKPIVPAPEADEEPVIIPIRKATPPPATDNSEYKIKLKKVKKKKIPKDDQ
ncbi:MAG: hypothetical protein H7256_09665 [Bdellovibrio sp.]|nr:hypothetical protein [Bdellovibrio sp.]